MSVQDIFHDLQQADAEIKATGRSAVRFGTEYYPSYTRCIPQARGFLLRGQKNGEWHEYHRNGRLKGIGDYRNNHKVGRWTYWDERGRPETMAYTPTLGQIPKGMKLLLRDRERDT